MFNLLTKSNNELFATTFWYQIQFKSQNYVVTEMLNEVYIKANNLNIEYELEGKSIDDK